MTELLETLVLDKTEPHKARMHALWSLVGNDWLDAAFHAKLLSNEDPSLRAWGVRAAGNFHRVDAQLTKTIVGLAADSSPDVKLQVAIAAGKLEEVDPVAVLLDVLAHSGDDPLIPAIVWQNLNPRMEDHVDEVIHRIATSDAVRQSPAFGLMLPKLVDRILGRKSHDVGPLATLAELMIKSDHSDNASAARFLAVLAQKTQTHELAGQELAELREKLRPVLTPMLSDGANGPLSLGVASLLASMGDHDAVVVKAVRRTLSATSEPEARRIEALGALLMLGDKNVLDEVAAIFAEPEKNSVSFRAAVLAALGRSEDPRVAVVVLGAYKALNPELQPRAIELLTQRSIWAKPLLDAIGQHEISADVLNVNQVQRLLGGHDKELAALVEAKWGSVRTERNPQREKVVEEMKKLISSHRGDATKGRIAFNKLCAQCHKMYGEGQDVGPDITSNGRASFDQLLSNVFDPSLVIGAGYQARIVTTTDGRVLTGLLAENNDQRVVLKLQGGKTETIPRDHVESLGISKLSLMPEGLEKQYTQQELIDLFEFLMLDKPPTDPTAKHIPGTPIMGEAAVAEFAQNSGKPSEQEPANWSSHELQAAHMIMSSFRETAVPTMCAECGAQVLVPHGRPGLKLKCPKCGSVLRAAPAAAPKSNELATRPLESVANATLAPSNDIAAEIDALLFCELSTDTASPPQEISGNDPPAETPSHTIPPTEVPPVH